MPKSKVRKKAVYTPPANRPGTTPVKVAGPTHPIYIGVMLGVMLLGLVWLVVNYLAGESISFMATRNRTPDDHAVALTSINTPM